MRTGTVATIVIILVLLVGGYLYFYEYPIAGSSGLIATTTEQTSGSVTFPAGGEILIPGQSYNLTWSDGTGSSNAIQIFLINTDLESQGESVAISDRIYDIPDLGSYRYTVPTTTPSGTYKFSIGALTSNTFQVGSLTTLTPAQIFSEVSAQLGFSRSQVGYFKEYGQDKVQYNLGEGVTFAYKLDGTWHISGPASSQEVPLCSTLTAVPVQYRQACYDASTGENLYIGSDGQNLNYPTAEGVTYIGL